jgi:hypothetical protein
MDLLKRFGGTKAQLPNTQQKAAPVLNCQTCTVLLEQLKEARLREARLSRQLERKDEQIGMVIQSKFETVHLSSEHNTDDKMSPVLPLDSLMDVQAHDDEAFINQVRATQ